MLSGVLLFISLGSLFTKGLNQGVDFVGGRTYTVRFDKDVSATQVEKDMVEVFGCAEAKTYGGDNQLKITTKYRVDETGTEIDDEIEQMTFEGLKTFPAQGLAMRSLWEIRKIKKLVEWNLTK